MTGGRHSRKPERNSESTVRVTKVENAPGCIADTDCMWRHDMGDPKTPANKLQHGRSASMWLSAHVKRWHNRHAIMHLRKNAIPYVILYIASAVPQSFYAPGLQQRSDFRVSNVWLAERRASVHQKSLNFQIRCHPFCVHLDRLRALRPQRDGS